MAAKGQRRTIDPRVLETHNALVTESISQIRARLQPHSRIGEGITQAKIADAMGVSRAHVSNLLSVHHPPRTVSLVTLVELLDAVGLRLRIESTDRDPLAGMDADSYG